MTRKKLLTILQGFRKLNVLLKRFPPLDAATYPNGFYLYRGQRYEGEIERLAIGEEFILSKLTSTSVDPEVCAENFTVGVETLYSVTQSSTPHPISRMLGFFWRIRFPPGLPFPYIGNDDEEEVVLPLGTKLRYLGAHVQPGGTPNAIYPDVETNLDTHTNFQGNVYGALICEFEVVEIVEGPLLQVLVDTVNRDFDTGNTAIYVSNLTGPPRALGADPDLFLLSKPIDPTDAFGKRRKTHKKKKPRATFRMRGRRLTHTPKRNRPRATRKK
jgi:hypothetical protein